MSDEVWVIKYDDADVEDEVFTGEGAEEIAREVYAKRQDNWTCHLLTRASDTVSKAVAQALADALNGIARSMEVLPWEHRSAREDAYIKVADAALEQARKAGLK